MKYAYLEEWIKTDKSIGYIKNNDDERFYRKAYKSQFYNARFMQLNDFETINFKVIHDSIKVYKRLLGLKK